MITRIAGWARRRVFAPRAHAVLIVSLHQSDRATAAACARALQNQAARALAANQKRAGFTLVEIIVALAILALSLNVILPVISDALWRTGEAEAQAEAASLARSLLAQAGSAVPLHDGTAAGQFENGFRWQLEVTPYGGADQAMPVRAYRVVAEVFWDDGRPRSLALATLRLGANGARR
jgi:general secretion pathway protein I